MTQQNPKSLAQLLEDINAEAMNGQCHRYPSEANRSFNRIRSLVTHAMRRAEDLQPERKHLQELPEGRRL